MKEEVNEQLKGIASRVNEDADIKKHFLSMIDKVDNILLKIEDLEVDLVLYAKDQVRENSHIDLLLKALNRSAEEFKALSKATKMLCDGENIDDIVKEINL